MEVVVTADIHYDDGKVKFTFYGHTHQKKRALVNGITAVNIGSDYLRKRFEIIEV